MNDSSSSSDESDECLEFPYNPAPFPAWYPSMYKNVLVSKKQSPDHHKSQRMQILGIISTYLYGISFYQRIRVFDIESKRWMEGDLIALPTRVCGEEEQMAIIRIYAVLNVPLLGGYAKDLGNNKYLLPAMNVKCADHTSSDNRIYPSSLLTDLHRPYYNALLSSVENIMSSYFHQFLEEEEDLQTKRYIGHMLTTQIMEFNPDVSLTSKITCSVCGFHAKINPSYIVLVDFGAKYANYIPDVNNTSIALTLYCFCDLCEEQVTYHEFVYRCPNLHDTCVKCCGKVMNELALIHNIIKAKTSLPEAVINIIAEFGLGIFFSESEGFVCE